MNKPVTYLHHTNYLHSQGGMQAMIRLHLAEGTDRAVSFRDPALHQADLRSDVLNATPGTSVRSIRAKYRKAIAGLDPAISVYHNCWGVELVHDLDPAPIRVGFLHSDFPEFAGYLRHFSKYLDAFVNINPGLHERCRKLLPDWPEKRFILLESPVVLPSELPNGNRDRCVIGITGRIKREQKRLDRLPDFLDACDRLLDDYEIQILGSGDFEQELRRKLGGRKNVRFLGWVEGPAYWEALSNWRYLLFLSDYEGTPLSLIEGVRAGLVPVYPDFHHGAPLPAMLNESNLYSPGSVEKAALRIAEFERTAPPALDPLKISELIRLHNPQRYLNRFAEALNPGRLRKVLPDRADQKTEKKSFPSWATLSLYNMHMKRLRFGWRGIVRHS